MDIYDGFAVYLRNLNLAFVKCIFIAYINDYMIQKIVEIKYFSNLTLEIFVKIIFRAFNIMNMYHSFKALKMDVK